MQTNKEN